MTIDKNIVFKKPERKLDSFLVPIRDNRGNRIKIRITDDIELQKILKVSEQDAYVIQCVIKDSHIKDALKRYDQQVLDHVVEHCNAWFGTDLSDETIHNMFLPSLNNGTELRSLVSSIIEPEIVLNNTPQHGFYDVLPVLESCNSLSTLRIMLEIDAQGIYIRSKRFGIRWIVKYLRIIQEDKLYAESAFDIGTREDVNHMLSDDINNLESMVLSEIDELHKKEQSLQNFIKNTNALMKQIESIGVASDNQSEKDWATKTETLSKMIWNYQRNRLIEK